MASLELACYGVLARVWLEGGRPEAVTLAQCVVAAAQHLRIADGAGLDLVSIRGNLLTWDDSLLNHAGERIIVIPAESCPLEFTMYQVPEALKAAPML